MIAEPKEGQENNNFSDHLKFVSVEHLSRTCFINGNPKWGIPLPTLLDNEAIENLVLEYCEKFNISYVSVWAVSELVYKVILSFKNDTKICTIEDNYLKPQKKNKPYKIRRLEVMMEIRQLVTEGYTYQEIRCKLNLPERTFFKYLYQIYEQDRKWLQEENKNEMTRQLAILKDRLTNAYREYYSIFTCPTISARDRISAGEVACELAVALAKIEQEGPTLIGNKVRNYYTKLQYRNNNDDE